MDSCFCNLPLLRRNILYFRQQFGAALQSTSFVVKCICVIIILCYFLSYSDYAIELISVTPAFLIPPNFYVWTAFTHCFLETRLWLLLSDIITIGLCGKLLEPLWGPFEMFTFFSVVNISVAFLSVMVYVLIYTITSDPRDLFSVNIHGLAGYCAAVSVAVKQIMPDHVILKTPVGRLKNRNVPLCVLLLSLILWSVEIVQSTYPVMFSAGLVSSWVYLRFYQHHSNGTIGDTAEHFKFTSFFPNILQPQLHTVCGTLCAVFVRLKICKRKDRFGSHQNVSPNAPSIDSHDAERRRQIALRALSERLNKVEQTSWPSDIELEVSEDDKEVIIEVPTSI